jgi:hypothetical protein
MVLDKNCQFAFWKYLSMHSSSVGINAGQLPESQNLECLGNLLENDPN